MPLLGPPFYGWTQGVMRLRGYYQGLALETAPGPTCLGVDPGGHAAPSPTALPVMHDRIKVPIAHFSYSPIENSRIYKSERFRSRKDRCWLSSGLAASPGRVPLNVKEGIINCQAVKSTARFSHQEGGICSGHRGPNENGTVGRLCLRFQGATPAPQLRC
jgi:hypothetical protein